MKEYYCWRCKRVMPYLDEKEWEEIAPYLGDAIEEIKRYRAENNCDLFTARSNCKPEATRKFEKITGVPNIHFDTIYHHRLNDWGRECPNCGHLLRSPKAKYCVNCGAKHSASA